MNLDPETHPAKRRLRRRRSRGQSLVEFALGVPIVLLLLCGAVDLGRGFYADITLTQAARDGVRALAASTSTGSGPGKAAACQAVTDATTNLGSGVTCTASCPSDPAGCTTDNSGTPAGQDVTVTVTYSFKPMTPVIGSLPAFKNGVIQLTSQAWMVASW